MFKFLSRLCQAAFAEEILQYIDDDNDYLKCVVFSDKVSFHASGKVNKHKVQIWGSLDPYEVVEQKTVPN